MNRQRAIELPACKYEYATRVNVLQSNETPTIPDIPLAGYYSNTRPPVVQTCQIDYAKAQVSTPYKILGVKVWCSCVEHKKGQFVLYSEHTKFCKIRMAGLRFAKQIVHNFVSKNMACKVVKVVVFHIKQLK